jgi:hypothetical protein
MSTDAGHPDNAALADFDGGVLGADQATQISAHISLCPTCARRLQAFDTTRRALHGLAEPPLPDSYANRIAAAVRAEQAARPVRPRLLSRWHGGAAALAAAAVVVLFVVGAVVGFNSGSHSKQTAANKPAGGARRIASGPQIQSTGRNYTAATMGTNVAALLATKAISATGGSAATPSPARAPQESTAQSLSLSAILQSYRDPAYLERCLSTLEAGPTAFAVDIAYFNRQPSAIIVVPATGHPNLLDVFVVPPNCNPNQVKFFRVPRP